MQRDDIVLVPRPSAFDWREDELRLQRGDEIALNRTDRDDLYPIADRLVSEFEEWSRLRPEIVVGDRSERRSVVAFERDEELGEEVYRLAVTADGVSIEYGDVAGAFYATRTLKQLLVQCGRTVPGVEIDDAPDFDERGLMLDISRNKIPTVETVGRLIEFMADLKLNHLQLYVEGSPFAYPSFPGVWRGGTPLTGEDIIALDRTCADHFVDLVPNQNSFGHVADWLAHEELKHLAESEDGFELWGDHHPPSTLDPTNPESTEFLAETYDDFLPYFSDERFNVGCDETFELGEGKSAAACEERGTGRVYLEHLENVHELLEQRGKRMMFWGDIINEYPELVPEMPADVIVLEWGYEADHPFDERAANYVDADVPFYVCPGTSSWNSLAGRTENMKGNLLGAAEAGVEHDARGYLITDWGDNGHWQPLPISYPGFAYGAALSWGVGENEDAPIATYLDRFVFEDATETVGEVLLDLGNYARLEDEPVANATNLFQILDSPYESEFRLDNVSHESLVEIEAYVADQIRRLERAEMDCADASLVEREIRTAASLVGHAARLGRLKLLDADDADFEPLLEHNAAEIDEIIAAFREIWLARNTYSDLEDSLERFEAHRETYDALQTDEA
ncbi:beta-N-acetylhexosaminidase [Halomontanus rarus]|uniref:beta-N-acetylhexosaminidase n=1 Tax=Halomontanus rarus TaxID=3034020 RepID=UPI0023E86C64|nr:family 20 glycosylhydrolase [Halovivax sp. TS33]